MQASGPVWISPFQTEQCLIKAIIRWKWKLPKSTPFLVVVARPSRLALLPFLFSFHNPKWKSFRGVRQSAPRWRASCDNPARFYTSNQRRRQLDPLDVTGTRRMANTLHAFWLTSLLTSGASVVLFLQILAMGSVTTNDWRYVKLCVV